MTTYKERGWEPLNEPSEEAMLLAFGAVPAERSPTEGYWRYDLADTDGAVAQVSFNAQERWISCVVVVGQREVLRVSSDGLTSIELASAHDGDEGPMLRAVCEWRYLSTTIRIKTRPSVNVYWRTHQTVY